MHEQVEKILITEEEIAKRIEEIAEVLNARFKGEEVLAVCVLTGSVMFYTDLLRKLNFPLELNFLKVSSYGSGSVSGELKVVMDLKTDIKDKNVIIVEDIVDTGNTIKKIKDMLGERKPKCLEICALLDKPSRRTCDISADYVGFEIPDEFVVGYGLDYDEHFRELPYVGVLKRSYYENN